MKALSIHPEPAMMIFAKKKTLEIRSWKTDYRGDILICSTQHKVKDTIPGHALCVVTLTDIFDFEKKHCKDAMIRESGFEPGLYAWKLENVRYIRPIPLKGRLSLWEYNGDIEYIDEPETDEEDKKLYHELYEPIFV